MNQINKRKKIVENVTSISPYDLGNTLETIYTTLHNTQTHYTKDREDIIETNWIWEADWDGRGNGRYILTITRLENDKEYNARIKRLKNKEIKSEYLKKKNIR